MFSRDLSLLAIGDESTPGTPVTPTAAIRMREIDWSPSVEMQGEKFSTGDHGQSEKYAGERTGDPKGYTYLSAPSAAATAPDWSILVTACGLVRTAHGSTGQSWAQRAAGDLQTKTIWGLKKEPGASPQQHSAQFKGCMGSLKISAGKRGEPIKLETSFKGAWYSDADIASGSVIPLGSVNTITGMKLLGWAATLHGITVRIDSFEVDGGQEIEMVPNQGDSQSTGIDHFYVKSAAPKIKLGVQLERVATIDYRTRWVGETIGSVILTNQGSGANLMQIRAPRAQITDVKYKEVSGVEYADVTLDLLRNGSADATMNAEDMWELLVGSKT